MNYYVYIMTNKYNTVLYTGVTRDLIRRTYEHKGKSTKSFTKRYNLTKLVYYEIFSDPRSAIEREKTLKKGSRRKKLELIESMNPQWRDLWDEITS